MHVQVCATNCTYRHLGFKRICQQIHFVVLKGFVMFGNWKSKHPLHIYILCNYTALFVSCWLGSKHCYFFRTSACNILAIQTLCNQELGLWTNNSPDFQSSSLSVCGFIGKITYMQLANDIHLVSNYC